MKNLDDLKKDLQNNPGLKKYFSNVTSEKEATKIAKELGYEVNEAKLKNDEELNESMLEAVAGGKGNTKIRRDFVVVAEDNKYKRVDIDEDTGAVLDYRLNLKRGKKG